MPEWSFERRRSVLYYDVLRPTAEAIAEFIGEHGDGYDDTLYAALRERLQEATDYSWPPDHDPAYRDVFRNYKRVLRPFSIASTEDGRLQLLWVGQWLAEQRPPREEFYRVMIETFHYPNEAFATHHEWLHFGHRLHPFRIIVETMRFLGQYGSAPSMTPLETFICLYNAHDDLPTEVLGEAVLRYRAGAPPPRELPRMAVPSVEDADYRQVREVLWFLVEGGVLHDGETIERDTLLTLHSSYLPSAPVRAEQEEQDAFGMVEGEVHRETLTLRRRNPQLRPIALEQYGGMCAVCGDEYDPSSGIEYYVLEVHHLRPFAALEGERAVTVDDVRIVCANCHRMLHSESPPLTVAALRALLHVD